MPTNQNNDMMVYCSFCGKSQDEVQNHCREQYDSNECVELAQEIVRVSRRSSCRGSSKTNRFRSP